MSKRLDGITGCKYKTSSWHLIGFRQRMRKDMLLLNMSRVQRAVVLGLKYTDFSTTYLSAQLPRKTYNFKGNQRIQRYTENTLNRQKIEMVNAPLLVQQFTHPVHPNRSYRLSYLLRQFVDKTGKIRNRERRQSTREKQAKQYTRQANIIFSRKVTMPV